MATLELEFDELKQKGMGDVTLTKREAVMAGKIYAACMAIHADGGGCETPDHIAVHEAAREYAHTQIDKYFADGSYYPSDYDQSIAAAKAYIARKRPILMQEVL